MYAVVQLCNHLASSREVYYAMCLLYSLTVLVNYEKVALPLCQVYPPELASYMNAEHATHVSFSLPHSLPSDTSRKERLELEGESEAVGGREAVRKERGDGVSMDHIRHQIQNTPRDTKPHPPLLTPLTLH